MDALKTITMYLPQFHRVPENDEWWGEGFTEWTAVRNAKPLYENHTQPRVPLEQNYYNLLEKQTMQRQAELMKKYGIDGQCFYHYYFKDGRKILEQPAERLLQWTDIDMPFCFCWANTSWSRTWSNTRGNSWADIYEKKNADCSQQKALLLEQKYGREEEWKKHFDYLLPFFKDKRYIKKKNAPVFLFYEPETIYCLGQMIDYWNTLAVESGFSGIYFIGMNAVNKMHGLDAILLHAPHMFWTQKYDEKRGGVWTADYGEVWNNIIETPPKGNCKTYFEGIVNFDDTPRRGKNGTVLQNFSLEKFQEGLCLLYKKSMLLENDFVFINAWNEWGEGMYLEPDEENGFKYLEAVKRAQEDAKVAGKDSFGFVAKKNTTEDDVVGQQYYYDRKVINCFERWMLLKEENKTLADYLSKYSIKTVAIYGMGMMGHHVLTELEKSCLEIKYIVDRRSEQNNPKYKIISPDDEFAEVDALIITPVGYFEEIYNDIKSKTQAKIFSLEEILYES